MWRFGWYVIIAFIVIAIFDFIDDNDDPGEIILGMLWPITLIAVSYVMVEELAKYIKEKETFKNVIL